MRKLILMPLIFLLYIFGCIYTYTPAVYNIKVEQDDLVINNVEKISKMGDCILTEFNIGNIKYENLICGNHKSTTELIQDQKTDWLWFISSLIKKDIITDNNITNNKAIQESFGAKEKDTANIKNLK